MRVWGKKEQETTFFKFYQKQICVIFLIFLIKSKQHKALKLTAVAVLGKYCTGNSNEDILMEHMSDFTTTNNKFVVSLVENHVNSPTKGS